VLSWSLWSLRADRLPVTSPASAPGSMVMLVVACAR